MYDGGEIKIVHFNEYCATCRHRDKDERDDPCFDCLAEPVNVYSHRPTKWESRE